MRALGLGCAAILRESDEGHKRRHYNPVGLWLQPEVAGIAVDKAMEGAERALRKKAAKQKRQLRGRAIEDLPLWTRQANGLVAGSLCTSYEKKYAQTSEAGCIEELPWMLDDAAWCDHTAVERDKCEANGRTAQGHHLHVTFSDQPYVGNFSQFEYCYNAQVQHILNIAFYGRDVKNMVDLGFGGVADFHDENRAQSLQ